MTAHEYYRDLLLQMLPPGGYDIGDGGIVYSWASALAKIIAQAEAAADTLELNVTPHRADELLDEWEALLEAPSGAGALDAERQSSLVARWRMAIGVSLFGIRSVMAPILSSTHFFRDECDDEDVSFRYSTITGGGASDEDTVRLRVRIPPAADGQWDGTNKLLHAQRIPIPDRKDGYTAEVLLDNYILGADDCHAGVMLYQDNRNAYMFGPYRTGGANSFALHTIVDNVVSMALAEVAEAAVPVPEWIVLERDAAAGTVAAKYGNTLATLTTLFTIDELTITPRWIGLYAANDATFSESGLEVETFQARQHLDHNNVEIIETPLLLVPATSPTNKFFFFVHRDPNDVGNYNVKTAQTVLDRVKSAHTLGIVGESDCFRCDDPYSLTDRDVLGS